MWDAVVMLVREAFPSYLLKVDRQIARQTDRQKGVPVTDKQTDR